MPSNLPSAADCKLTLEHWKRKESHLENLLAKARVGVFNATVDYVKAQAREKKITEAQETH